MAPPATGRLIREPASRTSSETAFSKTVVTQSTLQEFFYHAVTGAVEQRRVKADPLTVHYVVNLLTRFSHADKLPGGIRKGSSKRAMAEVYLEATQQPDSSLRAKALRNIGDRTLFLTGVFSQSLNRKVVDVDYYVALGKSAYGDLSHNTSFGTQALRETFDELGDKFTDFMDVLGEVSEGAVGRDDRDLLRLYEIWVRTGSRRARDKLRQAGLHPSEHAVSRARH